MQPLTQQDLKDIAQYEREREEFRRRVIELKRHRRVPVGDKLTFVFENRDTIRFQIQEMMRAERIVQPDRIQEELDTYNTLVPAENQLIATLLLEITNQAEMKEQLDRFMGIDRGGTTVLEIGGERVEGEYEGGHSNEEKISAVHYVTFKLSPGQAERIVRGEDPVKLVVRHRNYRHETSIAGDVLRSLANDLREP
ncbi:MAG: DUF3501 family protein [SAR202 cluster bacterium]|nr:DUF3501 family protein [SAR202 cluster bacterium]